MTVYVDNAQMRGFKLRGRSVRSCHMIADSLEELHAMADTIGMRRKWFQPNSFPHYDLMTTRRAAAISAGAIEVDRRELGSHIRRLRMTIQERGT